jgi:hypothetical protein
MQFYENIDSSSIEKEPKNRFFFSIRSKFEKKVNATFGVEELEN